ncbi:MAG: MFS transporter, partial [Acetobacteraceae bacterium]|nr:MFS transporter [Acetobacteraceae bacterium]
MLSMLGYQMTGVAIGWDVYAKTGSAYALGMIGLAQFLPMALLMLVAGHVADRYERRRVVALCQAVEAATLLFLALGSARGLLPVQAIFGAAAMLGAARSFEMATVAALLPSTVAIEVLPRAIALSTSATQTAVIIGPALGGFLYAQGGLTVYGLATVLFGLAATLITFARAVRPQPRREPPTLQSLFSGLHFIRQRPLLLGALSLDLFAVLLGGATALLPIYARDLLHIGPEGLGVLRATPAAGALCMAFVLTRRPLQRAAGKIMLAAVLSFGAATVVFGLSRSVPVSLLALFVLGASDNVSVVIRYSLVQLATPDAMRGRVNAAFQLFTGTSNQLGEFESGITAAW